jgi:hypothetical protein
MVPGLSTGRDRDSFENTFGYKPDDVVIVSYPKSGSTWLRFGLANLLSPTFSEQHQEVADAIDRTRDFR